MGNIVNKEITKDDICYDYIIEELLSKNGYSIEKVQHYISLMNTTLINKVIKIGELYSTVLIKEDYTKDYVDRLLVSVFAGSVCGKTKNISKEYAVQSVLDSKYVFITGFSSLNFCRIISFAACEPKDKDTIKLESVCAIKPYDTSVMKEFNENIKRDIKLNLGMITIFKCIQYFKELGYKYVILECNSDLIFYYTNLYFKVGTSRKNDYSKCFKHNYRITILNIIRESDIRERKCHIEDIENSTAYYGTKYGVDPKSMIDELLFYMYFDIEKYYHKLYNTLEGRLSDVFQTYEMRKLFDTKYTEDKALIFSKRFMDNVLLYENKEGF